MIYFGYLYVTYCHVESRPAIVRSLVRHLLMNFLTLLRVTDRWYVAKPCAGRAVVI